MPMIRTGENAYRILLALSEGNKRFNELLKEVKKASLAKELTELEKFRYIKRSVADTKPPTSSYSLTKLGKDFLSSKSDEHLQKIETELLRLKVIDPEKVKSIKSKL